MNSLFRPEVIAARKDTWLGRVQDVQPLSIKIISILALILTVIIVVYVYYGGYTRRIHTVGSMMPISGLVTVGSRVNGIVIEKSIEEGQFVKKGQKLFTISLENTSLTGPTQKQINIILKNKKDILQTQLRLKEEDAPIEKNSIKNTLTNLYVQYQKVTAQIKNDDHIIPLIQQSLSLIERARKLSLATNSEYQSQLYSYAQILSTHAQFLQNQTSIEGQILDNASKLRLYDNNLQKELSDIQNSINDIKQKIVENEQQQIVIITAPISGTVTAMRGYIGQQVDADSPLLSILPKGYTLAAELYVNSSAIGFLKKNDTVILRYSAFPYQKFGLYKGVISEITYTPVTSQTAGKEDSNQLKNEFSNKQGDSNLYRVRVIPEKNYIFGRNQKKYYLQTGMQVEADIAVDYRRLYQWMFEPIVEIKDTIKTRLVKPK